MFWERNFQNIGCIVFNRRESLSTHTEKINAGFAGVAFKKLDLPSRWGCLKAEVYRHWSIITGAKGIPLKMTHCLMESSEIAHNTVSKTKATIWKTQYISFSLLNWKDFFYIYFCLFPAYKMRWFLVTYYTQIKYPGCIQNTFPKFRGVFLKVNQGQKAI